MLNKIRQYPVIIRPDARAIDIEGSHHLDRHAVDIPESLTHRLPETFGFVIAGARPDHGNIPAILFRRGHMLVIGIPVNFARTGKEKALYLLFARKLQHVPRSDRPNVHRLDRELGVINRRSDPCGMDQIIDLFIRFERLDHIVLLEGQVIVRKNLLFVTGDEIVEQDRGKRFLEEFFIEIAKQQNDVITEETALPCDQKGLPFEILELVFEMLRQLDDVFPDNLRVIKPFVMRLSFGHEVHSFLEDSTTNPKNEL